MKRVSRFFFLFCIISLQLCADIDSFHLDARVSAFYPSNKLFRKIYGKCFANYEVEAGQVFMNKYEIWGNFSWLSKEGSTETFHSKTRFKNWNYSFGGKYLHHLNQRTDLYIGLGVNAAFVQVHNDSSHVKRHFHKREIGGVFKLGFYFKPADHLFFDLFADYLYQPIHFKNCYQIGGVKIGGGIGYAF